jgi:hypothetical protein
MESMRVAIQHMPTIKSQLRTIESQQRTIEQLTNVLKDKYEHGLLIVGEEGRLPMVIRNGKVLTDETTSYVAVSWTMGEMPHIAIEH